MAVMWAYIYYDDGAVAKAAAFILLLGQGPVENSEAMINK